MNNTSSKVSGTFSDSSTENLLRINVARWNEIAVTVESTFPLADIFSERMPRPHERILDYGCGNGRLGGWLASAGVFHVTGCDTSEQMCKIASRRCPKANYNTVDALIPDASEKPEFDVVALIGVLSSVPGQSLRRKFVTSLATRLKKGGHFYLADFGKSDSPTYKHRYLESRIDFASFISQEGILIHHFEKEELAALLPTSAIPVTKKSIKVRTMHGNVIPGHFVIATKR